MRAVEVAVQILAGMQPSPTPILQQAGAALRQALKKGSHLVKMQMTEQGALSGQVEPASRATEAGA